MECIKIIIKNLALTKKQTWSMSEFDSLLLSVKVLAPWIHILIFPNDKLQSMMISKLIPFLLNFA